MVRGGARLLLGAVGERVMEGEALLLDVPELIERGERVVDRGRL